MSTFTLCGSAGEISLSLSLCSHIFLVLRDHGVYMYVVYIWKWSSAHALGASVVWHHSLPLMNSFNKTEAVVFSCRLCFLRAFPFISLWADASQLLYLLLLADVLSYKDRIACVIILSQPSTWPWGSDLFFVLVTRIKLHSNVFSVTNGTGWGFLGHI